MALQSNIYRGNVNLKRINTPISWTMEQGLEMERCRNDVVYFSENYIKVITLDEGFTSIKLYDYQKEIIKSFNDSRQTIVATSRQVGKTTTAVCIILHYILFNKDVKVALLANKADSAKEVLERIQLAYEALPMWLQQGVVLFNKSKIILENKSQVMAGSTSSSSIRGKTVNVVYIDETAFVERWDTFYTSVFPVISSGKNTKILFTSTPNGLNHFYKFWTNAYKEGDEWNGFTPIMVRWQEVPGRDDEWAFNQLKGFDFDQQKFDQEYNVEFQGSSGTLISGQCLKTLVSQTPLLDRDGMRIYERPKDGKTYILSADVSHGKGLDYSAFHVIDVSQIPYRQVCSFRNNTTNAVDYAGIIHQTAVGYNNAFVLVENNDIGATVTELLLMEYEYDNLIYTETKSRAGKKISYGFGPKVEKGVRTSVTVKAVGCSMMKMLIEQGRLVINDADTIQELSTFSRKGKSYEAESGCKDDLVMCLVIFSWMTNQQFFKELADNDILNALKEKSSMDRETDAFAYGFIISGHEDNIFDDLEPLL